MHKKMITVISLICIITSLLVLNISVNRKIIYRNTVEEIVRQGYSESDIKNIEIHHSYINILLSYNEWRIAVEFIKVEDASFWFTYKKGKILYQGVNSPDKDITISYDKQYKNGTLLD